MATINARKNQFSKADAAELVPWSIIAPRANQNSTSQAAFFLGIMESEPHQEVNLRQRDIFNHLRKVRVRLECFIWQRVKRIRQQQ